MKKILLILLLMLAICPVAKAAGTFTSPRAVFPASRSVGIVVVLIGTGTAWSGSPFSIVNSVTGTTTAVIATQAVQTATQATVKITTGAGIGTFNISDGSSTYTLTTQLVTLEQGNVVVTPDAITATFVRSDNGQLVNVSAPSGSTAQQVITLVQGVSTQINGEAAFNTFLQFRAY
jgi:hypothetical protein